MNIKSRLEFPEELLGIWDAVYVNAVVRYKDATLAKELASRAAELLMVDTIQLARAQVPANSPQKEDAEYLAWKAAKAAEERAAYAAYTRAMSPAPPPVAAPSNVSEIRPPKLPGIE